MHLYSLTKFKHLFSQSRQTHMSHFQKNTHLYYRRCFFPVTLGYSNVSYLTRGVRLAKNDFGSVFSSVLQKTAVFGSALVKLLN